MTLGLIISFGGVLLVGAICFIISLALIRKSRENDRVTLTKASDLTHALDRADRAVKQAEAEIAYLRARIAS